MGGKISVAVKVGNSSNIKYNNAIKAYRVITVKELEHVLSEENITLIIIETVQKSEYERIKEVIKKENDRVLFYVRDRDETTYRLANELGCTIYTGLGNLYKDLMRQRIEIGNVGYGGSALKVEIQRLRGTIKKIEIERDKVRKELKNKGASKNEYDTVLKELENHKIELDKANKNIDRLNDTIDKYEDKMGELADAENTIEVLKESVIRYKGRIRELEDAEEIIKELKDDIEEFESTIKELDKARDTIDDLNINIEIYKERITKLEKDQLGKIKITELLVLATDHIKHTYEKLDLYAIELDEAKADIDKLNKEVSGVTQIRGEYDKEVFKIREEKMRVQGKLDLAISQLEDKELQYTTLINAIGMDEEGASKLIEYNKTMEGVNKLLREQILNLQEDVRKSNKERLDAVQNARNLKELNKQLKSSLNVITSGITAGTGFNIAPCNYSGKGGIIPVFGSGSFGITTTAVSIALELAMRHKVLFVDFDMVLPKADAWFRVNPIVKNIKGYGKIGKRVTGLGIFVDKQSQFFLENVRDIIMEAIKTKGGYVDYISGLYYRPDSMKMITADYTSLFNYCGNTYNYVVVDFGRLGSSEISDSIIKIIADIAYKNVVVTTDDKLEIRTFSMKLDEVGIDKNNVAWLMNMCESSSIDDLIKPFLGVAKYGTMPLNMSIFGKKIDFNKVRLTRDKLRLFIEESIHR